MPAFELDPAALVVARADAERVHAGLTAAVGEVAAQVTSLVGDGWRGPAATAFGEGFAEWRRGAEQVLAALATTSRLLAVTRREYVASDDVAADVLDRLGARLGALV